MVGFCFIVLAYAYLYGLTTHFHMYHQVPVLAFAAGIMILSVSDLYIYPHVLAFCSSRAPKNLGATVIGFVVFGMALSQLFGTYLARLASVHTPVGQLFLKQSWATYTDFFFTMTTLSMGIFCVLLGSIFWISRKQHGPQ